MARGGSSNTSGHISHIHEHACGDAAASRRMTQRDVAEAAGLHASTVSLALRGSTRVAAGTRERVNRIAASIGFAPDPLMQAFVAHRARTCVRTMRATLAYVVAGPMGSAARRRVAGARLGAGEFGLAFELHEIGAAGPNLRRLDQILFHRGVDGVILDLDDDGLPDWRDLALERLAVVAIGGGDLEPAVHRVAADHAGNLERAARHARDAGFRRIGVVVTADWGVPLARVCGASPCGAAQGIVSALVLGSRRDAPRELGAASELDAARLERWIREERPDAILAPVHRLRDVLDRCVDGVPGGAALIDLDRDDVADSRVPGVNQNHRDIGAAAVQMLRRMLERNACGIPPIATRTLLPGVWHAGCLDGGAIGSGNTDRGGVSSSVYCCHNSAAGC